MEQEQGMGIVYYEKERIFKLNTPKTSYVIGIVDEENFIGHIYYGRRIEDYDLTYMLRINENPRVPSVNNRDRVSFMDCFPVEYSGHGLGDFREDCLQVRDKNGHTAVSLSYKSHAIINGKPGLEGLPATFGTKEECTTLELTCEDKTLSLEVILLYTVFHDIDIITRSVRIKNLGSEKIMLTKVMSASIDIDSQRFASQGIGGQSIGGQSIDGQNIDLITMHGSWARERRVQRIKLGYGNHEVKSGRGESSHQEHPFIALLDKNADEDYGNVYGMHFVYSGNFTASASLSQFNSIRLMIGINPVDFAWNLPPGDVFTAPEAVLTYSYEGIGQMTRSFHDLYRNHLIRGKYKDKKRPILINNWEATYFDFNTDKLINIAREAKELGIEMLVMDDGWFGKRESDNCALGDWVVNEDKIKGGLKYLVDEVNKLGMKFGIWFEPEMISPDSDLFRAHPDWAIQIPGRKISLCREQYVLDITRKEIRDYVYESISKVLKSANIEYVKWDMNRPLTDLGSAHLDKYSGGELAHRYVLSVYELQERLITDFPDLLLENCSGGGGRFDPGMLYYSPQIWCSDDTDAIERLHIQYGTAMIYPVSAIGAHVSDCPNHTVGRVTPFETRGYTALFGTFGYELDVTKISEEDRRMIPVQTAMYHKYNDLIRQGDYYRIASYTINHEYDCWQIVSKDKSEALLTYIQVLNMPNYKSRNICLKGLDEKKKYKIEGTDRTYYGSTLMYAGIMIERLWGDFKGKMIHIIRI